MKKIKYLIPLIFLTACHSKTRTETAQDLVKHYLDSTLNDPKSYEPLEFSKLDSLYLRYHDSPEYAALLTKKTDFDSKKDSMVNVLIKDIDHFSEKKEDAFKKSADSIQAIIEKNETTYKGPFNGYAIIHNYRGKNALGGVVKTSMLFTFDKNLTKVTEASNND
jgi:hypothetical protein